MPPTNPANTPNQSSLQGSPSVEHPARRAQTPPSYLTALREIDSPVLDLAATLTTAADEEEDDADADNVNFLRTPLDPQDEWRAQNAAAEEELFEEVRTARQRVQARAAEIRQEDRNRRERLQRILSRLSRMQDPAYGDRIPNQNSLYDWAPASEDDEDELQEILQEIRRQRPGPPSETGRGAARPPPADAEGGGDARARPQSSRFLNTNQPSQSSESSLRSAAILQSVRRHPRFSARLRDNMQRYMMDRERSGLEGDERERYNLPRSLRTGLSAAEVNRYDRYITDRERWGYEDERERPNVPRPPRIGLNAPETSRYELNRLAWQNQQRSLDSQSSLHRDARSRIEAYRRGYLENPAGSGAPAPTWLEQTVHYLARLRSCRSYEESLSHAVDGGFVTKEFFAEDHDDFIMDISTLLPPAETSWLAPGAVFSGSQHASNLASAVPAYANSSTMVYQFPNERSMTSTTFEPALPPSDFTPNWSWPRTANVPPPLRAGNGNAIVRPATQLQDRWPVKVTIHAVDYDTMTLSATMEAYNVPSHPPSWIANIGNNDSNSSTPTAATAPPSQPPAPAPPPVTKTSSITTFLEGEILDFSTHTLLTESFASTPSTDATYWRKLEPFRTLSDDELIRRLVSRRAMEELRREWILMRWKERCFVRRKRRRGGAGTDTNSANNGNGGGGGNGPAITPTTDDKDVQMAIDDDDNCSDDGCGLTISGFYYVCLRRSNGVIEGLYCDPQSSPYQHLRLSPVGGGTRTFPGWAFR